MKHLGRVLRGLAAAAALAVVFVLAAAGGLVLHLNLAPLRRAAAARVDAVIASSLEGTMAIQSVGGIGLGGIEEGNVEVIDPSGKRAIALYGVRAKIQLAELLRSLVGRGPIVIHLTDVSIRAIDLAVDVDPAGTIPIQRAFASRTPTDPSAPAGRGVRLSLDRIVVQHAWVHGVPTAGLPIDADLDGVRGSIVVDPARVSIDATELTLTTRGMPLHADGKGSGSAHIAVPAPSGGLIGASVVWSGTAAGIAHSVKGTLDGDAIDVSVDAPNVSVAAVRALWPASPITEPAEAHLEAHGTFPRIDVHLRSTLENASFDVTGPIVLGAAQSANLHFDAHAIDIDTFSAGAPSSNLDASGDVSATRSAAGAIAAKGAIELAGGDIGGQRIPAATIKATFADDPVKGMRADATVSAREPGAPTLVTVHLVPKGRSVQLSFDADTRVPRLDAIPRLKTGAHGRSVLKTHGVIDFNHGVLDVQVQAELDGLGKDVIHVEHAQLDAHVSGSLRAPQIDAVVHGDLLDFAGYRFSRAQLEVHGPAGNASIQASLDADGDGTPDFSAAGQISVGSVTTIDAIQVRVAREKESIHIDVGSIRIAHGEVTIDPIEITGLGGPIRGSFSSSPGAIHVRAGGQGVDLARLGRVSHTEEGMEGCLLDIDVDATMKSNGADGHATFELGKCSVGSIQGASGGVAATLHGRLISGRAHAELEDVGSLVLTTPAIEIGGKGPLWATWKKGWGRVEFEGRVDLAKLAARLPRESVPLEHVQGIVAIAGRVQRDSPTDETPGVTLTLSTSGLALIGPRPKTIGPDGRPIVGPPAWRVEGLDLGVDLRVDGDSGFGSLAARLNDVNGQLVALDLKAGAVPYDEMLDAPGEALSLLEKVPFNARIVAPPRDMKALPPAFAPPGVRGELRADVSVTGTVLKPTVDVTAHVTRARVSGGLSFPIDLDLTGHYDGVHADAALIGASKGAQVIDAHAALDAKMADLLQGQSGDWTASARAHLDSMPLESVAALADRQVTGKVSGDLTLDGLHRDGRASFLLDFTGVKVGEVAYRIGTVRATVDGKAFGASVRLEQTDGSVDLTASAGTKWGAALLPALDPSRPFEGRLAAKNMRAAILLPFVDTTFTELDGRIDADMRVTLDEKTRRSQTQGTIAIKQGRFELAAMGGEFHDVTGRAVFTPDGVVKIEGVRASGMSGRIEAAASGRLNGLALVAANATAQIPASSPLLLTVEGTQIGTVEGRVDVSLKETATAIDVKVDVPALHVDLPLTSSRDVQRLGPIEGVRLGVETKAEGFSVERLDAPKQEITPPAGKTVTVAIVLGSDVQVKKSTQLKVTIAGEPTITLGDSGVVARGQIRLLTGTIDVQGKTFDIDTGTITFQGDPSDPQVVITASWTASDGTHVYAEMRGTLKSPKVTLRSEPSLSPNEILALLIYGSADMASPSSQTTGQGSAAAGVAGGAATQPLNRALENLGLGGVSTRVDTSSVTPRADVEVQIARDISLQIAEVMGIPPPGTNPDTTLFTLDWRFIRAWSAQTTIGSAGTSILDLVWQYRY